MSDEKGASSTISMILMIGLTVGMFSLASFFVFDLAEDPTETADASASLKFDPNIGDGKIEAEVVRNKNIKEFRLSLSDGSHVDSSSGFESGDFSSGDSAVIVSGVGNFGSSSVQLKSGKAGVAKVIAVVDSDNQNHQIIRTEQYST
jgi:FlaG/FlaF family flagellin (archaellin)